MILIADIDSAKAHKTLLDAFRPIYENGFPDPDELEPFNDIIKRTVGAGDPREPRSLVVLSVSDDDPKQLT